MKLGALKIVTFGIFLLFLGRSANLMIFQGSYYADLASGNKTTEEKIFADRGIIYDRNGRRLVYNTPGHRQYPYGSALAHVVGYINPVDREGREGLEKTYDQTLRGRDGKRLIEVNARGEQLRVLGESAPISGNDLKTFLDLKLQQTLDQELAGRKGAAVASVPKTGEILALVSSPGFDPSRVAEFLTDTTEPLFNRAISATYPPGSTFKIVVATAGLETAKITAATTFDDPGILIIGPYKFPNWKYLKDGGTQGILDVVGALKVSNDVFFYKTGEWVGIDALVGWAKKFGLNSPLGIDLPGEAVGNVPAGVDYLGDLYHLAIGQGDLLVTPLQVNAWTSVIASGGKLCKPQVVQETNCRNLGISEKTIKLIKQGMVEACAPGGTAYPLFGLNMACKTGTAEFGPSTGSGQATHAWLTGFYPIDNPEIAITVLVEGGGEGSDVAAPIIKKAIELWSKR